MENHFELLYSNFPSTQGEDQISWNLTKNGKFEDKSFLEVLRVSRGVPFPCQSI